MAAVLYPKGILTIIIIWPTGHSIKLFAKYFVVINQWLSAPYQRSFLLKRMVTDTETDNWTKCRDYGVFGLNWDIYIRLPTSIRSGDILKDGNGRKMLRERCWGKNAANSVFSTVGET